MAVNTTIKGNNADYEYYRISKTIGHKLNENGKEVPVVKQFYGRTKKEAEAKYQAFLDKQNQGIESKQQYFGVLADTWIKEFFINDGNIKDSTKERYFKAWNNHVTKLDLYRQPLEKVTAKTIQSAYNNLVASGCSVSEIRTLHKLMRKFYKYIEAENIGRNVTSSLTIPKAKVNQAADEIKVWSDEELKMIFSNFDKADPRFRLRFLIVLAFYSGCRKSEMLALTYDDITDEGIRINKQISIISDGIIKNGKMETHLGVTDPKSSKSVRTIPVDPEVMKELQMHKQWHANEQLKNGYRTNFIFTTDSGQFYEPKNIDRALYRYYDRIGIEPKSIHTFRHSYATSLCKNGVPIQTAAALLGHESIETTLRYYVNVDEEEMRKAAMTVRMVLGA